ncbi:hypothetical protein MKX03_024409, partial [Papaver bracteatum]
QCSSTKNLDNANASIEVLIADLQFLRAQVTITQVTITRVQNWDVHQRRKFLQLLRKTTEGFLLSHGLFLLTLVRVCRIVPWLGPVVVAFTRSSFCRRFLLLLAG